MKKFGLLFSGAFVCYSLFSQTPGAGNCLEFNGSNYLEILSSPSLNCQSITIEYWVYANSLNVWNANVEYDNGTDYGVHCFLAGPGNSFFATNASSVYINWAEGAINHAYCSPLNSISANQWYHIAVTRSNATVAIYINGEQQPLTLAIGSPISSGAVIKTNYPIQFGIRKATMALGLNGKMDEIRIWNVARSQNQIRDNMCSKLVGTEANLVGYWRLDEISGNTAMDSSPLGNNGTGY